MEQKSALYADIISFDWENVLISYDSGSAGFVSLTLNPGNMKIKSVEASGNGRFAVSGLKPETTYTAEISSSSGEKSLTFTTLPAPEGRETGSFALISDPHVACNSENRKGRFFVESEMLLREALQKCLEMGIRQLIMPGDITNHGEEKEYLVCREILKTFPGEVIAVPGNHDAVTGLWDEYFDCRSCETLLPGGYNLIAVDTSGKILTDADAEMIEKAIGRDGRAIITSHYQFFNSPVISHSGPVANIIDNFAERASLLEKITDSNSILYVGHQNITTVTRIGKAIQINLPQIPQFPCGFIRVRCFGNSWYHDFIPIGSEVLRQWSRKAGDAAAEFYKEHQWSGAYRVGHGPEESNFLLNIE